MLKRIIYLFILISLILSACAQNRGGVVPTSAQTGGGATIQAPKGAKPPGCTVVSHPATPDPTQQSLIPPPSKEDWSQGPEEAYVTIIEYGDFQ